MSNDLNNEPLREGGYHEVTFMESLGDNRSPKWHFQWEKHGRVIGEGEEKVGAIVSQPRCGRISAQGCSHMVRQQSSGSSRPTPVKGISLLAQARTPGGLGAQ